MPIISVIVPVYKVEKVVHYCIYSILKQTFTDFELILVDDGSPDNSGKICDEYALKDDRIEVVHKLNGGVSSARNTGINIAKGEYIVFIDSDDYVDKDYLQGLISTKKLYSYTDNIWCGFRTVKSYSDNENYIKQVMFDDVEKISFSNAKSIMTLHDKWLDAGPYCKLYSRKTIIDNNLFFDEDLSLGEDLIFNFRYLDCTNGDIAILNKDSYSYFINENSLASKYYPDLFEIYQRINATMKYYVEKWNCDSEQISKLYNSCFFKYEVVLKNTFSCENKLSYCKKVAYNSNILKSKEFAESFSEMSYKPNVLYKMAYRSKKYIFVRMVDKIFNIAKK